MTIKEIEEKSGMPRANIRFYETEGLLNPERRGNGYREYSEEDLEILMKIKLLRALHISLEEIKSLHTGEHALLDTLNQHLAKLEKEEKDIAKAQKVCKVMQSDGVQYQTLDAKHYLKVIEQTTKEPVELPASDFIPKVHIPWRRYFARTLDFAIYSTLWNVALIMNVNTIQESTAVGNLLEDILILLIMLLVEPVLLCLFGTTPGKWILGIRVTDNEGRRLTYSEARARTRSVLLRGVGLWLPIYSLYRLWKSYKADSDGETLDWEYHSEITLKDERGWRIFAYLGARAALIGMLVLSIAMSGLPKNRGDITVAQFCENYNRLAKYYDMDTVSHLDSEGNWTQYGSTMYGASFGSVSFGGNHELPDFIFEEQDGIMTGMHFSVHVQGHEIVATNMEELFLSILAFAGAQKGSGPFHNQTKDVIENISESPFESFQYSVYGVNIACDVEYSGYFYTNLGMLWPQEDLEHYYSLTFSMEKEEP